MSKMDEYKHPKWQALRLKALQVHSFHCGRCGTPEKTLHVHHKRYPKGKIWECETSDLSVLCEDCHKEIEDLVLFAREHGEELRLVFDHLLWKFSPADLLQMFISQHSGQMSETANGAFLVAASALRIAHTLDSRGRQE